MGTEKPRNKYEYEYIDALRKMTVKAFHHYENKIVFKPNKSRGSKGYKKLQGLLKAFVHKDISDSALVEFFNKTYYYDSELQKNVIQFEVYTVEAFEEFVKLYEKDADELDDGGAIFLDNTIKVLLHELYTRNKSISEVETTTTIEENGFAIIKSDVFIKALSDIAVLRIQVYSDTSIKVENAHAYETMSKRKFALYPYDISETSYFAFIVFPKLLPKDDVLRYSYKLDVVNHNIGLIQNGYLIVERLIIPGRYRSIIEHYSFPNTAFFTNVKLTVKNHPNQELIDKEIVPIFRDDQKIFSIDFGNLGEAETLIKFEIRL